jgi:hypothetical protein
MKKTIGRKSRVRVPLREPVLLEKFETKSQDRKSLKIIIGSGFMLGPILMLQP